MSRIWRGRRTGLMIDDSQVAKDADGMDNIDSFWDNAQIEADTASTPGCSSSQGVSTPSSVASPAAYSPGTAESASWVGVGALEAAGGDDSQGTDNEAAAEEGESRMPAKRLEYRLPPKSLMAARSEASTDEELMAEGTARVGQGAGGKPGGEKANRNRSDGFGDEDDDDTETDGDQQHQEQQEYQQRQEEHHRQQQQQQEQRQLQQQQQQNTQQDKEQETQQQQNTHKNKQQQTQQQQQQPQEPGGASGGTTPADAADAAAGGKGESTPKGNHGSARSVRDRGGSARGRGKGRGAASPAATSVAGTAATQAAGKATETPARMSTGGVKDDGITSEAVGTRSGGRGWRKQVQHDSSSDDDDDDGGGGGGGPWSFDDMEQDEGRDAEGSADRAPRPKSVSPRGGVKGSTPTQSPRLSSRSSPRTKLPSPRGGSVGVASSSSTQRKSVDGDDSPPFPSPRRSRGRGGDSGSPPGSSSTKRSSGGSNRKGRPTKHKPASPPPSTVKRKGKGKGMGGDGDREEEDDEKEEEEGSAAGGGGGTGDDGEGRDVFDYDGGVDDQSGGVGENSGGDIGGVEGIENEGGPPSPLTRGASKAKGRAQSRNAEETGEAKEEEGNKRKRKDNDRVSEGAGAKKSSSRGKRGGALHSLRSPRSGEGPRFVAIPEVSERSHTPGTRRSGRNRVAPIKFWKGDNIQYGVDEQGLPVAEGIVKGMGPSTPGPSKKRLRGEGGQRGRKRARASKPMTPMKATQLAALPKGKYLEKEEECMVWDEETATNMRRHVVMRATNLVNHTLAATLDRPPGKEKVGSAAQAFNVPGEVGISEWLSGRLVVPKGAIKDSEHVAYSTQIYVVAEGQPNALELAIAMPNKKLKSQSNIFDPKTAQRFLLSPGDHFFVPVNNIYRLENHSEKSQAVIYWTILKSSGS